MPRARPKAEETRHEGGYPDMGDQLRIDPSASYTLALRRSAGETPKKEVAGVEMT